MNGNSTNNVTQEHYNPAPLITQPGTGAHANIARLTKTVKKTILITYVMHQLKVISI